VACAWLWQTAEGQEQKHARERVYAWKLGIKLSQAAWGHYTGATPESVNSLLEDCRTLARQGLGAEIPAFPAKKDKSAEREAQAMHYISSTGGKPIGQHLAKRYGDEMANLFELAMKARLAVILYVPKAGDDLNEASLQALTRTGKGAGLPPSLWNPLVTKIKETAPHAEVKAAFERLDEEVTKHLLEAVKK
jgi:hypothetical protein